MHGKRILVVDDDAEMRSWLRLAIESNGAIIDDAPNGREALRSLKNDGPFDLVVTDMRMPLLSGIDLIAAARLEGLRTPFILITGLGEDGLRQRVDELDPAVVLTKPFDLPELIACAERLFDR